MTFPLRSALFILSLLLGACASLPPPAADALGRAALASQLDDKGFNFALSVQVKAIETTGAEGELDSLLGPLASLPTGGLEPIRAMGMDSVRALRFDIDGAVDLQAHRLEILPTLRFERRNLHAAISLPMLADGREMALYLDPAAFDWTLPGMRERQGKLIRLADPSLAGRVDIGRLLDQLRAANRSAYAAIPAARFSFAELSAAERQAGAVHKVRLQLDSADNQAISQRWLDTVFGSLRPAAANDADSPAATLHGMGELLKALLAGSHSRSDSLLLLDAQGRLLGSETDSVLEQGQARLTVHSSSRFASRNAPRFTVQVLPGQYYEASELQGLLARREHHSDSALPLELAEPPTAEPPSQAPPTVAPKPAKPAKRRKPAAAS